MYTTVVTPRSQHIYGLSLKLKMYIYVLKCCETLALIPLSVTNIERKWKMVKKRYSSLAAENPIKSSIQCQSHEQTLK